jgi:hypothetical protein
MKVFATIATTIWEGGTLDRRQEKKWGGGEEEGTE